MAENSLYRAYATPDYLARQQEAETWIVEDILPSGGTLSLYGPPKLGKSYLALQLAAAVSADTDCWLHYRVRQNGRVLYLQFDTPPSLWKSLHLTVMKGAGYSLTGVYHADKATLPWPFDILDEDNYLALEAVVEQVEPLVVIVDTLRESSSGEENASGAQKEVVQQYQRVAGMAAIVFVGHSKKPGESGIGAPVDGLRGSSYISGKMDTIVQCRKKSIQLVGRAIEDTSMRTHRTPFLWEPLGDAAAIEAVIQDILADGALTTDRQRARAMAARVHKPEETCRSLLRRAVK